MNQKPSIGRIVLFAFAAAAGGAVEERPAIIVRTNDPREGESCNLQVFTDGSNDDALLDSGESAGSPPIRRTDRVVWRTSIRPSDDPNVPQAGRWRWPPRVG